MRWDSASCWLYIFNLSLSSLDKHGLPGSPAAVAMWLHCSESRTADSDEETETVSTRALIEPCVAVDDCWTTRGEICRYTCLSNWKICVQSKYVSVIHLGEGPCIPIYVEKRHISPLTSKHKQTQRSLKFRLQLPHLSEVNAFPMSAGERLRKHIV